MLKAIYDALYHSHILNFYIKVIGRLFLFEIIQKGRVFIMAKKGNVKNYSKDKGYEIIPRDFLQDEELSLQAIGLLSNLQSYPEDWELNKTEVYNRYKKNKRTSVANAWEELVEEKYIVQLRRRNGKKWDYIYYFNLERFTEEKVKDLEEKEQATAMSFRKPEAQRKSAEIWDVENGKPKMGSPKPADKRIHSQENTHKENTQDLKDLELKEIEEEEEYIVRAREDNIAYEILKEELTQKEIDKETVKNIIGQLHEYDINLFEMQNVEKQFTHMMDKQLAGQRIYDFAFYFAKGLKDLTLQSKATKQYQKEKLAEYAISQQNRPKVAFYDWLTEREA